MGKFAFNIPVVADRGFVIPQFAIGQTVTTPKGEGMIVGMHWGESDRWVCMVVIPPSTDIEDFDEAELEPLAT